MMLIRNIAFFSCLLIPCLAQAELQLSAVFGDHMVVQRDKPIHVWGWTKPGQAVSATLAGKSASGTADDGGRFDLQLPELPAGGPHELVVKADETKQFTDVLVGEVWICSGQSNMQWNVKSANDPDLESLTAKYPNLRLITVPQVGTQEPQKSFQGQWRHARQSRLKSFRQWVISLAVNCTRPWMSQSD